MRRLLRNSFLAAALACLLAGALAVVAAGAGSAPSQQRRQAMPHSLYWGAWIGDQITGTEPPWDMRAVTRFESAVGHGLSVIEFGSPLAECQGSSCSFGSFPATPMQTIREYGAIPFLNWSTASTPEDAEEPEFQLADIISGRYDRQIRAFARGAAAWGHPFFLRFDWEMNGNWFPWGQGVNGNQPGEFVKAWRHVHDIFTAAGATNATWVWCPYANAKGSLGKFGSFYPGGRYVDWTCLDGYNFAGNGANPRPWQTFDEIFYPSYLKITRQLAPNKPMILGELSSNVPAARKAAWIRQMFQSVVRNYPLVYGLVWFDKFDRDMRWPVEVDPAPAKAFRAGLRSNPFLGPQFGALDASPIPPPS